MSNEKRHIFLVGPSGVGKTTIAQLVADRTGKIFVDVDDVIEHRVGMSITEFFEKEGEPAFREVEREIIRELSIAADPTVVATGGGTVLDTRNVIDMRNNGYVVSLDAFEADIVSRLQGDNVRERPLLKDDMEEKVHYQYLSRRECYELSADVTIATSRRDAVAVSDAVIRQCERMSGVSADGSADGSASVVVGEDVLASIASYIAQYPHAVLISQESVPQQYRDAVSQSLESAGVDVIACLVEDSEDAKSFEGFEKVINEMSAKRVTRSSCVIALGGGVVGDLSGFVASTYHRGIDVIQVPTTLLAQVDSSIGGKCGINLAGGKNLVGTFHQPKIILADTSTLFTLPENDYLSGLGEVVKYALLGNTSVADAIRMSSADIKARKANVLVPVIRSCMNHKIHIVARDPYERNGIRATLNLGHTLAHAMETATHYKIPHGVAVALGLRFIAQLSCAMGRISEVQRDDSIALIDALGLEAHIPHECRDAKVLVDLMYADKKSEGDLSLILLNIGGGAELVHDVDREIVESTLTEFISQSI